LAHEHDWAARFQREAKVLASLNHPNLAAIYGFEESSHLHALVLELVEGPTLADRIAQGPIPLDDALLIATQIAEAIEAAHEHGVIHRDLKPANIKLRPDGVVKVLDFGLAKAVEPTAAALASLPPAPKVTATQPGVILGTAAYMSPEQARGRAVDKRTDIWAYGCVLYEMLTGRAAFQREAVSDTIASIFAGAPDWRALPKRTPARIRRLLHRCLEKDPHRRLHDIADARIELDDGIDSQPDGNMAPIASHRNERLAWASVLALVMLTAAATAMWSRRPSAPAPEMRLEIATPPTTNLRSLAISPDGRALVFAATVDGRSKLWLRPLDAASPRPLDGTDSASDPFWSPDKSIARVLRGRTAQAHGPRPWIDTGVGSCISGQHRRLESRGCDSLQCRIWGQRPDAYSGRRRTTACSDTKHPAAGGGCRQFSRVLARWASLSLSRGRAGGGHLRRRA
jgi:eukaryotic-like serine/threonine-protein kinase